MQVAARKTNANISFVPEGFTVPHVWMRADERQLRNSLGFVYELICAAVEKREHCRLRVSAQSARIAAFDNIVGCMLTHRIVGIADDGSYLVDYRILELGKPDNHLVEGSLRLKKT